MSEITSPPETPELDKQAEIIRSGKAALVQDFYDWLEAQDIHLCKMDRYRRDEEGEIIYLPNGELVERIEPRYYPYVAQPEQIMAEFFGINRNTIEKERRALLAHLRTLDS
jgi:hypothetical protein